MPIIDKAYQEFVDKFKPGKNHKMTTDDCYTPPNIYSAAKNWAVEKYGLENAEIVRPFYPGGDYEHYNYPYGCVVIDNPPFSILSKICSFYEENDIKYFLFAPTLTLFKDYEKRNFIPCGVPVEYQNGAVVSTSFVTNMGEYKILLSGNLYQALDFENRINRGVNKFQKYECPANLVTPSRIYHLNKRLGNEEFGIYASCCKFVRSLDCQRQKGKSIVGNGFFVSNECAESLERIKRRPIPKKSNGAVTWDLSEREKEIIKNLSDKK